MPVYGDLTTMSLCDLLQWAGANRKTGVLELERNKVCRRIEFRKGRISACSSDDPPTLLGQFLLARGKITRECLQEALARQQKTGEHLGVILREMRVLSLRDLERQVAAKAEETIQGLFDWEDAVFRFHEGATLEPNQIAVSLSVDDVLLNGVQHHDELKRIRRVFESSGIVLARSGKPAPEQLLRRPVARRIWESIDGERTLAEILLHAHGSEFLVIKLLRSLHESGFVETREVRPVALDTATLLDPPPPAPQEVAESWGSFGQNDFELERDLPERTLLPPSRFDASRAAGAGAELDAEVDVASRLLERGEYEAALELLNASYRAHPDESHLRRLIAKAESAYVEHVQRQGLRYDRVPVPLPDKDGSTLKGLGPQESFLMSLLDGKADVRSILWIAPLREVDLLRTLRLMLDKRLIELREGGAGEAGGGAPGSPAVVAGTVPSSD